MDRLAKEADRSVVSSFFNKDVADRAVSLALSTHRDEIAAWMQSKEWRLPLIQTFDVPVGELWWRDGESRLSSTIQVILHKRNGGFTIRTSFPMVAP
jgi:hypothetical protein